MRAPVIKIRGRILPLVFLQALLAAPLEALPVTYEQRIDVSSAGVVGVYDLLVEDVDFNGFDDVIATGPSRLSGYLNRRTGFQLRKHRRLW